MRRRRSSSRSSGRQESVSGEAHERTRSRCMTRAGQGDKRCIISYLHAPSLQIDIISCRHRTVVRSSRDVPWFEPVVTFPRGLSSLDEGFRLLALGLFLLFCVALTDKVGSPFADLMDALRFRLLSRRCLRAAPLIGTLHNRRVTFVARERSDVMESKKSTTGWRVKLALSSSPQQGKRGNTSCGLV